MIATHCSPVPEIEGQQRGHSIDLKRALMDCWFCELPPANTRFTVFQNYGDFLLGGNAGLALTSSGIEATEEILTIPGARIGGETIGVILQHNSQWLSRPEEPALKYPGTGGLTFSLWTRIYAKHDDRILISKSGEYDLRYSAALDAFTFTLWGPPDDFTKHFVVADGAPPTIQTWYHLIAWYDPARGKAFLQVNFNVTAGTSSAEPPTTGAALEVGRNGHCLLNQLARWNRVLNETERTVLFYDSLPSMIETGARLMPSTIPAYGPSAPEPSEPLDAPVDLTCVVIADLPNLSWTISTPFHESIEVWRQVDPGEFELIATLTETDPATRDFFLADQFEDTTAVDPELAYVYKIRCRNESSASLFSNLASNTGMSELDFRHSFNSQYISI